MFDQKKCFAERTCSKKENERRSERKAKSKGEGEEEGRRSKREGTDFWIKREANHNIPAGIHGRFRDIFRGVVLCRGVLSRRCFLLCRTYFTCNGLYPFADLRVEFIRCISWQFQFGAVSGVGDSHAEAGAEAENRDAGDRHSDSISPARAGFSGAFPNVFPWLRDCAVRSVFNWDWRRSVAVCYMVRDML